MNRPKVDCPACHDTRCRVVDGEWVVICGIILRDDLAGKETYPNFEIVPSNCRDYLSCQVWRDEKDRSWRDKMRREGIDRHEQIRLGARGM
jgi:hypothetical protein